jgi:ABC-type antimicrobial peptide transport system permease subunit
VESVLYLSFLQVPWPFMTVVAEARSDVAAAARAVREEVARLAPDQAAGSVRMLEDLRTEWLVAPRARATLLGLFSAAALVITLVGLYGSVTREVSARFKEFAIRQALGAQPAAVTTALTLRAVAATAAGLALGVTLLFVVFQPLQRQATADIAPIEATSLAMLVSLAGAVALLAAYVPARRASAANPADVLRAE